MVGHQAIRQDTHRPTPTRGLDQLDERGVVARLVEDLRAGVAAIEDVVVEVGWVTTQLRQWVKTSSIPHS